MEHYKSTYKGAEVDAAIAAALEINATLSSALTPINNQLATIGSKIGNLANLQTTEKSNLVGAINEVKNVVKNIPVDTNIKVYLGASDEYAYEFVAGVTYYLYMKDAIVANPMTLTTRVERTGSKVDTIGVIENVNTILKFTATQDAHWLRAGYSEGTKGTLVVTEGVPSKYLQNEIDSAQNTIEKNEADIEDLYKNSHAPNERIHPFKKYQGAINANGEPSENAQCVYTEYLYKSFYISLLKNFTLVSVAYYQTDNKQFIKRDSLQVSQYKCFLDDNVCAIVTIKSTLSPTSTTTPDDVQYSEFSYLSQLDGFTVLKDAFSKVPLVFTEGYVNIGEIGEASDYTVIKTQGTLWTHAVADCEENDIFVVSGESGALSARLYGIYDEDDILLEKAEPSLHDSNIYLKIPHLGKKIVINTKDGALSYKLTSKFDIQNELGNNKDLPISQDLFTKETQKTRVFTGSLIPPFVFDMPAFTALNGTVPNADFNLLKENSNITDYYTKLQIVIDDSNGYLTKTVLGKDQSDVYDIWKVHAGNSNCPRKVVFTCQIHGNDSDSNLSSYLAYWLSKFLSTEYKTNKVAMYLRQNYEFVFIPICNPYGYMRASAGYTDGRYNSRGVNINRNFSVDWWGTSGAEGNEYGTDPFSEKETQYIRDMILDNTDAWLFIDVHTHPEGSSEGVCAGFGIENEVKLFRASARFTNMVFEGTGTILDDTQYTKAGGSSVLYARTIVPMAGLVEFAPKNQDTNVIFDEVSIKRAMTQFVSLLMQNG